MALAVVHMYKAALKYDVIKSLFAISFLIKDPFEQQLSIEADVHVNQAVARIDSSKATDVCPRRTYYAKTRC